MVDLHQKNVIITGASTGIGKNIAETFFNYKSNIFLISRSETKLKEVASTLSKNKYKNQTVEYFASDITNQKEIYKIFNEIYNNYHSIDVLINNAGITNDSLLITMKNNQWNDVINTNLNGTYNCCKSVSKYMIKQKCGKIINISSIIAQIGNKGQSNYAASKAGIIGFTKSLAKELASRNINVNVINPGYIQTDMTKDMDNKTKSSYLDIIPLNRFGDTADVSNLACFLASKKSNYITGQSINIDGGLVMQS